MSDSVTIIREIISHFEGSGDGFVDTHSGPSKTMGARPLVAQRCIMLDGKKYLLQVTELPEEQKAYVPLESISIPAVREHIPLGRLVR
jgi:hypothetical protein